MQNRCYLLLLLFIIVVSYFLNNSSKAHAHELATLRNFISLRAFIVYMENSLRFEICTEKSFTKPEVM